MSGTTFPGVPIFPTSLALRLEYDTTPTTSVLDIVQSPCTEDSDPPPPWVDAVVQNGEHSQPECRMSLPSSPPLSRPIVHASFPVGTQGPVADQNARVH